jgi:hypothetical protein
LFLRFKSAFEKNYKFFIFSLLQVDIFFVFCAFEKNYKFFIFSLLQVDIFFVFSDHFDALISKIILKK